MGDNGENEKERLNRKLEELLQELRVALPGVQVLFAFLLTLPFTGSFPKHDAVLRGSYIFTLLLAAGASAFLIAPSAYHRLRWREVEHETLDEKHQMLVTAGRLAATGIVLLGFAISGAVFLVADAMFGVPKALSFGGLVFLVIGALWYALPLSRRLRDDGRSS